MNGEKMRKEKKFVFGEHKKIQLSQRVYIHNSHNFFFHSCGAEKEKNHMFPIFSILNKNKKHMTRRCQKKKSYEFIYYVKKKLLQHSSNHFVHPQKAAALKCYRKNFSSVFYCC